MKENNSSNTKKITLSALLIAIVVIILFLASVLPTSRISLYVLSSFFVSIIVFEYKVRDGWIFYLASSLLSIIVIQVKIRLIPYVLFFGMYGIIKCYIEKLNNLFLEYLLKFLYFNVCLVLAIIFIKSVFIPETMDIKFPLWVIIAALEVVFLIYDYVYTLFISYYRNRIKKILKIL